ncbi:MAG: hypothetical protein DMG65_20650 [Candidatus Angelobacter sp. Gp1-AA117]|nr:MAG: hypothetical protein DMG65_20650 [Candidatus Angelobacter sp. Gp1-AA117]
MSDFQPKISRRKFAVGAAVAAAGVLLPGAEVDAQSSSTAQQPSSSTRLSPDAQAEVDAKVKEIFRKYGKRLSDEQKADIRKVMGETQSGLEKMRAYALENSDQPAAVLKFTEGEKSNARTQ